MNMNLSDPRAFGPRIRMMMPHLTPMEARVVETMLGRREFDATTSLKEIAEDAGVSEAMVVKIAKKLGFGGFKEFRTGLVDYRSLPRADLQQLGDRVREVVRRQVAATSRKLEGLDLTFLPGVARFRDAR